MSPVQFDKLISTIHKMYNIVGERPFMFFMNQIVENNLTEYQKDELDGYGVICICNDSMLPNKNKVYIVDGEEIRCKIPITSMKNTIIGVYNIKGDY